MAITGVRFSAAVLADMFRCSSSEETFTVETFPGLRSLSIKAMRKSEACTVTPANEAWEGFVCGCPRSLTGKASHV